VIARAGRMPKNAAPIELRAGADGTLRAWHDGYELVDFDSGAPVQIPADATDAQAFEAVKASGAFGKSTKFFDAPKADAAAPTPQATPKTTADAPPAPAAAAPAPITPPADSGVKADEQDRQGLREEDRRLRKLNSNAEELLGQMVNDVTEDDFDPAEVLPSLERWARDVGLPVDDLRADVLRLLNKDTIVSKADRKKLVDALNPTKAPALVKTDKAEMRPYRKPDGSVGYEAVPIVAAEPAQVDETAKVQVDETPNLQSPKPPAQPAAQKVAALSDPEAFSDDYASFEGRTVEQTVSISDTGRTALVRIDAAKAMRALDARLKVLTELKGCIGRAA